MTESTHDERVQESGVVGHSYDTDDRIGDLDIYEALVNPHEGGAGQKKGGAGGPTMMPMGGAGAGSGSSTGSPTAAGTTGNSALKGTSAASAGTGAASGVSGTGGAGAGGIAGTGFGGGLGTDTLAGVGGAGGGLSSLSGLGSGPGSSGLSGSSWGSPSFGTGAAGLTDPRSDLPVIDPGSMGGLTLPTVPATPTPTTPTIPTPTIPTTNPGGSTSPITMPSTNAPSMSGIKAPSAGGVGGGLPSGGGGGGGAGANTSDLGVKTVKASPEMLHKEAQHWDDTSKEFAADVTNPIGNQSPSSVDFGMMKDAFPSYNDLLTRLKKWSTEAGTEFSAISEALQAASGGYSDTEATNTATAAHTGSSRPE